MQVAYWPWHFTFMAILLILQSTALWNPIEIILIGQELLHTINSIKQCHASVSKLSIDLLFIKIFGLGIVFISD